MAFIDYATGKTFIEGFMIDSCAITRQKAGTGGQVLDPGTGALVDPVGTITTQYTGKCVIKKPKSEEVPKTIAGQWTDYSVYKILLPFAGEDIRFGDILTVTASRDAVLLAHKMRIMDVTAGTHAIYRALYAVDLTAGVRTTD